MNKHFALVLASMITVSYLNGSDNCSRSSSSSEGSAIRQSRKGQKVDSRKGSNQLHAVRIRGCSAGEALDALAALDEIYAMPGKDYKKKK